MDMNWEWQRKVEHAVNTALADMYDDVADILEDVYGDLEKSHIGGTMDRRIKSALGGALQRMKKSLWELAPSAPAQEIVSDVLRGSKEIAEFLGLGADSVSMRAWSRKNPYAPIARFKNKSLLASREDLAFYLARARKA